MPEPEPDAIDRLFAKLEPVEPPPDFAARLMARLAAEPEAAPAPGWRRGFVYAVAYLLCLVTLTLLAYWAGVSMAHSGTGTLIGTLLDDAEVFGYAPSAYLQAIAESIPWLQVAALALNLIALALVTRLLVRGARRIQRRATGEM